MQGSKYTRYYYLTQVLLKPVKNSWNASRTFLFEFFSKVIACRISIDKTLFHFQHQLNLHSTLNQSVSQRFHQWSCSPSPQETVLLHTSFFTLLQTCIEQYKWIANLNSCVNASIKAFFPSVPKAQRHWSSFCIDTKEAVKCKNDGKFSLVQVPKILEIFYPDVFGQVVGGTLLVYTRILPDRI